VEAAACINHLTYYPVHVCHDLLIDVIALTMAFLACSVKSQWKDFGEVPATIPTVSYHSYI